MAITTISKKKLSPREKKLLKKGMSFLRRKLDFSIESKVIYDHRVIHIKDGHSENEEIYDQKNVDDRDFERLEEVVTNFDTVKLGNWSRNNAPTLVYTKLIDGHKYFVIMELLTRQRVLAVTTMYIWLPIKVS